MVAALSHSEDFARAARAEADRLRLDAQRAREAASRHLALAEQATKEAILRERRVRELDELLGRAPQLRIDLQAEGLRGQRLREAAIEILAKRRKLGEPIHYRKWFELLLSEGHTVQGKNPLATFLTQVTRSPVVIRQGDHPGVYRVDPEDGSRAALCELGRAQDELRALRQRLEAGGDDEDGRDGLLVELAAAERRVAAAERALSEVARAQASVRALAS